MKPTRHVTAFLLMNALTFSLAYSHAVAAQGHGNSHSGSQANSPLSNKGTPNTKAQWSADPERGWVRKSEEQGHATTKQNQGKQKPNGGKEKKNN